jgi:hypothetical protein
LFTWSNGSRSRANGEGEAIRRGPIRPGHAQDLGRELRVWEGEAEVAGDADDPVARVEEHPVGRDPGGEPPVGKAALDRAARPDPSVADHRRREPQRVAHRHGLVELQLDTPDDPAQPTRPVPGAIEAHLLRVPPCDVLRVAEEGGDAHPAVRPSLVEAHAVAGEEAVVDTHDGAGLPTGEAGVEGACRFAGGWSAFIAEA